MPAWWKMSMINLAPLLCRVPVSLMADPKLKIQSPFRKLCPIGLGSGGFCTVYSIYEVYTCTYSIFTPPIGVYIQAVYYCIVRICITAFLTSSRPARGGSGRAAGRPPAEVRMHRPPRPRARPTTSSKSSSSYHAPLVLPSRSS